MGSGHSYKVTNVFVSTHYLSKKRCPNAAALATNFIFISNSNNVFSSGMFDVVVVWLSGNATSCINKITLH